MIIKTGLTKQTIIEYIITMIVLFCLFTFAFNYIAGMIILGAIFFYTAFLFVGLNRKIIMDEKGCTIYTPWCEKQYSWEMFLIKRIEEHEIGGNARWDNVNTAFFSVNYVKKPKWMHPITYKVLHPFSASTIAIEFYYKGRPLTKNYSYDEKYFREKMKEWNVELEEVRMRDWEK